MSGSARATPIGAKLMQAVLDKNNGESISDNNYTYTPPAEPEDNNGDDLNSETEIVEDVVEPEDDYVIGSDTINGNPETNTEPNPETTRKILMTNKILRKTCRKETVHKKIILQMKGTAMKPFPMNIMTNKDINLKLSISRGNISFNCDLFLFLMESKVM